MNACVHVLVYVHIP